MVNTQNPLAVTFCSTCDHRYRLFLYWDTLGSRGTKNAFNLDGNSVETLRIIGPGEKSVLLEKVEKSGEWGLPEFDGFPANSQAVVQLIDQLTNTELGMQVSKQTDSFDRMKVADNNFERKVEIGKASEMKTIFFGSAPALRQAHARLSGEKIVYAVKFARETLT